MKIHYSRNENYQKAFYHQQVIDTLNYISNTHAKDNQLYLNKNSLESPQRSSQPDFFWKYSFIALAIFSLLTAGFLVWFWKKFFLFYFFRLTQ